MTVKAPICLTLIIVQALCVYVSNYDIISWIVGLYVVREIFTLDSSQFQHSDSWFLAIIAFICTDTGHVLLSGNHSQSVQQFCPPVSVSALINGHYG